MSVASQLTPDLNDLFVSLQPSLRWTALSMHKSLLIFNPKLKTVDTSLKTSSADFHQLDLLTSLIF